MELFVETYMTVLVSSQNYVTKRQSIKLLSTLLLERQNYSLMTRFVESPVHLKTFMNLLRDQARMIQYESFHVFKIFVANPNKSAAVERILIVNKSKLLRFLPTFCDDRAEDVQFNDEKAYCVRMIDKLPDSVPVTDGVQQMTSAGAITA